MKKFLLLIVALFALVIPANAGVLSLTSPSSGGIEIGGLWDTMPTPSCSVSSSKTSRTIWTSCNMQSNRKGFDLEDGWQYVLAHDTLTGAGAASHTVEVVLQALDQHDNAIYTGIVDSITNAEQYGGQHLIPLATKALGVKYKIILQYDTGNEVIFKRLYIYRFRYIDLNRNAR